jgi:acetyl esterase/lipase
LNMWEKDGRINFLRKVIGEQLEGKFVLVSVGYRVTHLATWPAQINDVKSAIRYLKTNAGHFRIDPNRIGVAGFSAGAFLCQSLATSGNLVKTLEGDVGVEYDPKNGIDSKIACALLFSAGAGTTIFDKSIDNPQAIGRLLKAAFEEDGTTSLDDVLSKRLDGRPYIRTKENGYPGSSLYGSGYEKAHYPMISASPYYLMDWMDSPGPPILSVAGDKDEYGPSSNQEKFVRKYRKHKGIANMIRVSNMTHDKDYLFRPELQETHWKAIQNIRAFLLKHLYDENREIRDITIPATD